MDDLTHYPNGIHALDSGYGRPALAAIYIVVEQGRAAIIDTGTNASVPRVLSALAVLGVAPTAVDWVMLTHVHLDHAGGAGSLIGALPQARLLVHPRGLRHMMDPGKLWDGVSAVYGAERAYQLYGHLLPIDPERMMPATDGLEIRLADRPVRVFDTPGHARHHVCYWDEQARAFFTGDTFGLSYRELDVDGRAFVVPTTTPSQFDPQALHQSIDRMLALEPKTMYLTHFGGVSDVHRLADDLHRLIDTMVVMAQAARGDGVARHVEILASLEQLIREEVGRQGWALDEEQSLALLRNDLELNAQGLGVWLDSQLQSAAQPA